MSSTFVWQGWLLEEDYALKQALTGITVQDVNDRTRPVPVWFRMPESEQRTVTYPHIIIDFLGQRVEHDREHQGWVPSDYEPYTNNFVDRWYSEFPIPLSLDYQISTGARSAQHDRQLMAALTFGPLISRRGSLTCTGGTVRRLDVLQEGVNGDGVDRDSKRYFRKIWTVRISSEISIQQAAGSRVEAFIMSLVDRDNTSQQYSSYRAVGSNQESLQAVESETVHVVVRDSDSVVATEGQSVTHP